MIVDADFDARFNNFLGLIQKLENEYHLKNFPTLKPGHFEIEVGSKFIRVFRCDGGPGRSAHCFVAKCDNETKVLGKVVKGDIFRCATWKQPAKHCRGNIFDSSNGMSLMGPYGPAYLK